MPMPAARKWTDERVANLIGQVLRAGVVLAAVVVLAGGAIYVARHAHETVEMRAFHGEPAQYSTVRGILADAGDVRGRGLIQLGLLLLIATPVARVAMSALAFALERDRLYVTLALIVLGVLLLSLAGFANHATPGHGPSANAPTTRAPAAGG